MNTITTYISEAIEELHHVRWPTRHQAVRLAIIVVIFVFACTAFFGAVDYLLSKLVHLLLSFI